MNVPTKGGELFESTDTLATDITCHRPSLLRPSVHLQTPISEDCSPRDCRLTSNVHFIWGIDSLAIHVADGHMSHHEYKTNPWHQWAFDVGSNSICANRAYEQRASAGPEIEEADKIES